MVFVDRPHLDAATPRRAVERVRAADALTTLVCTVAVAFICGFVSAALFRLSYPFALQVTEPAMLAEVERILRGQALYVQPSLQYIPMIYGPVYFYLSAVGAEVIGDSYLPPRLVSLVASVATIVLIGRLIQRETGSSSAALLGGGLYAATFPFSETGQDLGRVDALFTCLLVAAFFAARRPAWVPSQTRASLLASGALIGLAGLTKIPLGVAPVGLGVGAYVVLAYRRSAVWYVLAAMSVLAIGLGLLRLQTGAWATWFLWDLPRLHEPRSDLVGRFWFEDLLPRFSIALLLGPLFILDRLVRRDVRPLTAYTLFAGGMLALAWASRSNAGGAPNVLLPAFAMVAIAFGLGVHAALEQIGRATPRARAFRAYALGLGLLQLALLAYNPRITVPLRSDQWADERLSARLVSLPAPIFAPDLDAYTRGSDKAGQPMFGAIDEVRGAFGGPGTPEGRDLMAELDHDLSARHFTYVVLDQKDCCLHDLVLAHGYVDGGPLFPPDDEFYLWKSWRTPDERLYAAPGQDPAPPLPHATAP